MADYRDVMTAEKDVTDILNKMDEERDIVYNGSLAVSAICLAIIALGVRVDYAISTINRP